MNVGYACGGSVSAVDDMNCPICSSDIYINKHNTDFICQNDNCILSGSFAALYDKVEKIFELNGPKQEKSMSSDTITEVYNSIHRKKGGL